jgi:acyl-CoA thioester hydrolase
MPRIIIDLPEKFTFSTNVPVRIEDINRGSHVGNVSLLTIVEEARAQFLISRDYEEEVHISKGVGFIIGDIGIIYKNQAGYGKPIKVEVGAVDFKNKSFDLVYKLSDISTGDVIAIAKTGVLYFDYYQQKVLPVSDEMRRRIQG